MLRDELGIFLLAMAIGILLVLLIAPVVVLMLPSLNVTQHVTAAPSGGGYLSDYVDGYAYCNFTTSSMAATIVFAGNTGSQSIWNLGPSTSCGNCSSTSWIEATYGAFAPCGSTSYNHYGVIDVFYTLPGGAREAS